jgi:hypothetical protein
MLIGGPKAPQRADVPSWLDKVIGKPDVIGSKETAAQVLKIDSRNRLHSFVCLCVTGLPLLRENMETWKSQGSKKMIGESRGS